MSEIQPLKQDPDVVDSLVSKLHEGANKEYSKAGSFTCRKSEFKRENIQELQSWKFQEWAYERPEMPTYARGLFTAKNSEGHYEIVARGYDKFFNIDETTDTQWESIKSATKGPYELSTKENGCIIFMSGLEDGTLLVCSKHSTGFKEGSSEATHAKVGEQWIQRHVESVGRTTQDLAKALRRLNVTAVGELCDDSFEEHVLAYGPDKAGIYLHGINYNLPEFVTLSGGKVHQFADAWGFRKANYIVKESLDDVKEFLDKCAKTGSWNGQETEGFVVRCQKRTDETYPYRDWFFKYKFEEPYLMYRQWRECTNAVIAEKEPKIKKHEIITRRYVHYARRRFFAEPKLAEQYTHNHGIISLRNDFLREVGRSGAEIIAMEDVTEGHANDKVKENVVLVTVATLGCGKTTLANALVHLFKWGHIQNDNIQGKKSRPQQFATQVLTAMSTHPVTIADRNNHQRKERKQIIEDVLQIEPRAKFVALHYVHEPKIDLLDSIRKVTTARVLERGDNHQTIQASSSDEAKILGIMDGFLHRFQGVNPDMPPDDSFDQIIDLDPRVSSRENLEKVITNLHKQFPALMRENMPSASDLDDAIKQSIENYTVNMKHELSFGSKNNQKKPKLAGKPSPINQPAANAAQKKQDWHEQLVKRSEYFHISVPPSDIKSLLERLFTLFTPASQAKTYRRLVENKRIQSNFHVTLIHYTSKNTEVEIWQHYIEHFRSRLANDASDTCEPPVLGKSRVRLDKLIWDDRLMCFTAHILPHESESTDPKDSTVWPCANDVAHITVGTVSPDVKPKESNDLLRRYLEVGAGGDTGIWELDIPEETILVGTVCAALRMR